MTTIWIITAVLTGFAVGVMAALHEPVERALMAEIDRRYIRKRWGECETLKRLTGCEAIDIVFKDRPDNPTLEFVEIEIDGKSVSLGEWHYGADWVYLRLGKGIEG